MGEVSAAEPLFSTLFMFAKSVSNSSTYRQHKDEVDLAAAQKRQEHECLLTSCLELVTLAFSGEKRSSMA